MVLLFNALNKTGVRLKMFNNVKLSDINSKVIEGVIKELEIKGIANNNLDLLKSKSIDFWKFAAKELSNYKGSSFNDFNRRFNLIGLAELMIENDLSLSEKFVSHKKKKQSTYYGVIVRLIWNREGDIPKLIGKEQIVGVVKEGWLYYLNDNREIKRASVTANKALNYYPFTNIDKLLMNFPKYKKDKDFLVNLYTKLNKN